MVSNPADLDQMSLLRPNDSADVFVESFAKVWDDGRVTVFCGIDHVVCQLCETAHLASPAVAASRLGGFGRYGLCGLTPAATC